VPLLLVLHGGGGNADNAERMTGFTAKAQREGFIVVYPEGSSRFRQKLLTWNAGHCCGYAMEHKVDDVGFIQSLIKQLLKQYPIDSARVYVTGMSNGGMMTHRLGRELAGQVAAIAPVVATVFGDESNAGQPVSALMFNGMLDESVPYLGGPPGGRFNDAWDGTPAKPALDQGVYWAGVNGCAKEPVRQDRGDHVHWRYACPPGRAVELYLLKDSGHAWPGGQKGSRRGDAPGTSVNATDVIWEFFAAQGKLR
jgi:polyhydroxybutyrate depolymerase